MKPAEVIPVNPMQQTGASGDFGLLQGGRGHRSTPYRTTSIEVSPRGREMLEILECVFASLEAPELATEAE